MIGSGKVAVIGAGAWGTALAIQLLRAGPALAPVLLWARDPARALAIAAQRRNARHLPDAPLPPALRVTGDVRAALSDAALAILAVPVPHLGSVLPDLPPGLPCLVASRGLEAGTLLLPLEILAQARPDAPAALLSGPHRAEEVAAGLPASAILAGADPDLRAAAIARLATPAFRIGGSADPVGAGVAGAAAGVAAVVAGAAIGAGLGEGARAALVTRALAEIARLAVALGGRGDTVAGPAGLGALMLACAGPDGRDFSLGLALGESAEAVSADRLTGTESADTAPALLARATAAGVEVPVLAAASALLEGQAAGDVLGGLLGRA